MQLSLNIDYKDVINYIEKGLYPYTNDNKISGFIVYLFHMISCGFPMLYIMIGEVDLLFWLSIALWAFVFWLHFFFKGCILVKTERYLWNTKEWYGPWSFVFFPLEYLFDIKISKQSSELVFLSYGVFATLFVINKIWKYMKK